jgi:uncharacterized OB-fold protein
VTRIALVDYLALDGEPHLVAQECTSCSARFFDRRSACASCGLLEFKEVPVPTTGTLRSFTIVAFAAEGVEVPFVAGVVDCGGTLVRGNIVHTPPDPEHVTLGMPVRLTTVPVGTDSAVVEAVGYGFEPIS